MKGSYNSIESRTEDEIYSVTERNQEEGLREFERKMEKEEEEEDDEEGGWRGWTVVVASFFCIAILDGVGYTTGLLLNSLIVDLGAGRAEVSVLGSLQVGVYSLGGPIVGRLVKELGTRPVCILGAVISSVGMVIASFGTRLDVVLLGYSVVSGVGFGLMYIPSVVGAAPFFNKRRSLAMGICLCGSGVGTFTLAPISEFILSRYGWNWVFRFFAVLCGGCIACGALMFSKKTREEKEEKKVETRLEESQKLVEELRTPYRVIDPALFNDPHFPTFLLVLLADFVAFIGIYIPYTHLPPLALSRNISAADSAFLISAGGISNTFGRFLGGYLCDQPAFHPLYLTFISILLNAVPALIIPRMTSYGAFFTLFSLFGLSSGCMVGSTSPLLLRLLGLKALSESFGLVTAFRGIAALIGPPVAGLLVEWLSDPGAAMDLTGALELLAAGLYIIAITMHSVVKRRAQYTQL